MEAPHDLGAEEQANVPPQAAVMIHPNARVPILYLGYAVAQADLDAYNKFGLTLVPCPTGLRVAQPDVMLQLSYLEARTAVSIPRDACVFAYTRRTLLHGFNNVHDFPPLHTTFVQPSVTAIVRVLGCGLPDSVQCECATPDFCYFGPDIGSYSTDAVATLLSRATTGVGYAMFPRVSNIAGSLGKGGALTYHSPEFGVFNFSLRHGPSFNTLDPMWIHSGRHVVAGRYTLASRVIECTECFTLYEVRLIDYAPADDAPRDEEQGAFVRPWTGIDTVAPDSSLVYSTAVGGNPYRPSFDWVAFGVRRIRVLSHVVVFTTASHNNILFSREIAWRAARFYMGRSRDQVTLQAITRYVAGQYSSVVDLPEHLKYSAQLATVAFVMSTVEMELSAIGHIARQCHIAWNVHRETFALRPPLELTPTKVVGGFVYFGLSSYTAHSVGLEVLSHAAAGNASVNSTLLAVNVAPPHNALLSSMMTVHHAAVFKCTAAVAAGFHLPLAVPIWAFATAGLACWSMFTKHVSPSPVPTWLSTPAELQPPVLPTGVYHVPYESRFGPTSRIKAPPVAQKPGTLVRMPLCPIIRAPTERVVHAGIAFGEIPRYFENNAANQATALLSRLTLQTPAPVAGLWSRVADAYLNTPGEKELTRILSEPGSAFYLNRASVGAYAAKFGIVRAKELVEAYTEWHIRGDVYLPSDFIVSSFNKGELHVKPDFVSGLEEPGGQPAEATPRSIVSFKPVMNATLGPVVGFFDGMQRDLRKADDDRPFSPYCPEGVNGETLGAWLHYWVYELGGPENVVTGDGDSTKFDAHTTRDALVSGQVMTVKRVNVRPRSVFKGFEAQLNVKGKTKDGVVFRAGAVRCSGASDTSKGNSAISSAKTSYCLEEPENTRNAVMRFSGLGVNYAIAVLGDDIYFVMRAEYYDRVFPQDSGAVRIAAYAYELGYEDTIHIHRGVDGEFCSRLWYPVGGTWLPGGKIGRTLAKAGFLFDAPESQTLKSATIGSLQDNYHVPFLREYFEVVMLHARRQRLPVGGKPNEYTIHMASKHEYDSSTMEYVYRHYGLTQADLDDFKRLLASVKSLPAIIAWPHFNRVLAIDCA